MRYPTLDKDNISLSVSRKYSLSLIKKNEVTKRIFGRYLKFCCRIKRTQNDVKALYFILPVLRLTISYFI